MTQACATRQESSPQADRDPDCQCGAPQPRPPKVLVLEWRFGWRLASRGFDWRKQPVSSCQRSRTSMLSAPESFNIPSIRPKKLWLWKSAVPFVRVRHRDTGGCPSSRETESSLLQSTHTAGQASDGKEGEVEGVRMRGVLRHGARTIATVP